MLRPTVFVFLLTLCWSEAMNANIRYHGTFNLRTHFTTNPLGLEEVSDSSSSSSSETSEDLSLFVDESRLTRLLLENAKKIRLNGFRPITTANMDTSTTFTTAVEDPSTTRKAVSDLSSSSLTETSEDLWQSIDESSLTQRLLERAKKRMWNISRSITQDVSSKASSLPPTTRTSNDSYDLQLYMVIRKPLTFKLFIKSEDNESKLLNASRKSSHTEFVPHSNDIIRRRRNVYDLNQENSPFSPSYFDNYKGFVQHDSDDILQLYKAARTTDHTKDQFIKYGPVLGIFIKPLIKLSIYVIAFIIFVLCVCVYCLWILLKKCMSAFKKSDNDNSTKKHCETKNRKDSVAVKNKNLQFCSATV